MNTSQSIKIVAFYQFTNMVEINRTKTILYKFCQFNSSLKGTVLLAPEGINGTVAGEHKHIDAFVEFLLAQDEVDDLNYKFSYAEINPFNRMKIKLKKEIVTIGIGEVDPLTKIGTYVDPKDWNEIISDPEVLLIDTRNDYEYEVGSFKGAINPHTKTFREFPNYVNDKINLSKHKKIAMFCTGGIRCEKASSYMLDQGFKEVYQLKGGILNYLEKTPEDESLWQGDCFVFDNRAAVNHNLDSDGFEMCHACRRAVSIKDKNSEKFIQGVSCPKCFDTQSEQNRLRAAARQKQYDLRDDR